MDSWPVQPTKSVLLRRIAIITLIAISTALVLVVGLPPAYGGFKSWRSKRLASQAERLVQEQNWTAAQQKAQAALLLRKNEPGALRAMARILAHATNGLALQFWRQLILSDQASDFERREFVEFAIQARANDQAAVELRRLLDEGPNQPVNLWLASQLYASAGDYSQTVYYATRAHLHDPTNSQYLLFLSSLLFDATDLEKRAEAQKNVWDLARSADRNGLEALSFLGGRLDLSPEQRRVLISLLEANPLSGTSEKLLALDQSIRLTPERRPQILDEAVNRYKGSDPAILVEFIVWLNHHEEFQRTLDCLPLESALKRKDLFIPHLDAIASLGRWQELDGILETRRIPLEQVYAEGFRARCSMQLSKTPAQALHWKNALIGAERNPEQLTWLAYYAEKCGAWEEAAKAWRSVIRCVADPRAPYQALEQLTQRHATTEDLRQLLAEMRKRWPKDPSLRNDYAYLSLLLAKEVPESKQTAEELVATFPNSLPHRTTLALALYRSNDFPAALSVYNGTQYDWRLALPGNRAIYAAILAASGKIEDAREQIRSIPRDGLRAEELELIRSIM